MIRLPLLEDTWGGQRNRFEFCSDRCAADWLTKRSSLEPATQPAPRSKWWKDWWS